MIAILGVLLAGTVAPIGGGAALTLPAARHLVRIDTGRGRPPAWFLAIQQDSANHHGLWFVRSDDAGATWSPYAPIQDDWTERDTPDVIVVGKDIALVYSYEGPTLTGSARHDVFFQWWRWDGADDWFPAPPVRVFDSTSSVTGYYRGLIALDSFGRIWIQAFRLNTDGTHTAVVTVSTDGGTTFTQQPSLATLADRGGGRLISLGTRLMFLYGAHGCCQVGKMRLRNDSDPLSSWSTAATALPDGIYHGAALSAVADGAGGLHLAYKSLAERLYYRHFDGTSWSAAILLEGTLQAGSNWALQPAVTRLGDDLVVFYNQMITNNTSYRWVYRTLRAGSFSSPSTLDSSDGFKGYPTSFDTLPVSTTLVPCIFGKTANASTSGNAAIVFAPAPAPSAEPPPPPPPPPDGGTPDGGAGAPPATPGTLLFADSFDRTSSSGLGPDWRVLAGRWRTDSRANSDFTGLDRANVNGITCADCRIDARFNGFATPATGFTLRETPSGDRYEMVVLSNGRLQIRRWTSGSMTVLGDVASGIAWLNDWSTAAFSVQGDGPVQLTGSINGSLKLTVTDTSAQAIAAAGGAGLTTREAGTWFDDFKLTALGGGGSGGSPDGGTPDGGIPDAGTTPDAGAPDAGPPPAAGVLFFDDFNRSDRTGLGPNWTIAAGKYITDGRANSLLTTFDQAYVKGITCADCRIDARMVGFGTELALTLRGDPAAPQNRYDLALTSDGRLRIRRWRGGSVTVLGDVASGLPWLTEFESFSFTVSGTAPVTLTAALNGKVKLTVTDGSSAALTESGMAGFTNLVAGTWIDDFTLTGFDEVGSGTPDGGIPDGGINPDAGIPDGGTNPDAGVPDAGTPPPQGNPISAENARPGDAWRNTHTAQQGEIEGYASPISVQHGESVEIHVRANAAHTFTWDVFRMGYYQGLGGRRVASGGPLAVGPQPMPSANATTGRIECAWPTTFRVQTQPDWTSGIYLLRLTRDDGFQRYVIFVVRADERKGVAVVQASVTTWAAYNFWGGESLYRTSTGQSGGFAKEVSFDRPFDQGSGTGDYFLFFEQFFILWAESRGYDLTYLTNLDVDRDPSLLDGQKLFVSNAHDEYWSGGERSAVEAAISHGVNVAFLSADNLEWQVRLESSSSGAARHTVVCHKGMPSDPLRGTPLETTQWRSAALNRPENGLIGVMYDSYQNQSFPFVVANSSHWVYAGTGVRDGDSLAPIVGYEFDRVYDNGRTPPDLVVLARSPVVRHDGTAGMQNASVYTAASGAWVFAAGTIEWSWGLSGGPYTPGVADATIQRMTANLFDRAGLPASSTGATFGASGLNN
ncbi:MAG TPA: N,N-dimethylformamidase beta subunit family domain-containing protein [Myxococcales bacterium]|nr:N,N-dimethylformamidase beta subunit family domain-containing protein [Myxococcales bacterium]